MKKLLVAAVLFTSIAACNSDGTLNEQKVDSAGAKLQHGVESTVDTIGNEIERFADSLHKDRDTVY